MNRREPFELDANLIRHVVYANNVIHRLTTRLIYGSEGLTNSQFVLLLVLREAEGPLSMSELAARAHVIKQAITPAYQRLQARGLIQEVRDARDRRVCRISLTPEGEALMTRLEPIRRAVFEEWLGSAEPAAKNAAFDVLEQIIDGENRVGLGKNGKHLVRSGSRAAKGEPQ